MKHIFTLLLLTVSLQAWSINASVEFLRFSTIEKQYLEVNYRIFANSLAISDAESANQVLSTILIYRGEEIVDYQKNLLVGSNTEISTDLLDVRRFLLQPGDYRVVVELEDQNGLKQVFKVEKQVSIEAQKDMSMSDIMLLATISQSDEESPMVRNGVYMEVLPHAYYGKDLDVLISYLEVYGLQDQDKYYCSYEIISGYDSATETQEVVKYKRLESKELQACLLKLDISDIASGDYHLVVNVYNGNKEIVDSKASTFVRVNPKADIANLSKGMNRINNSFVTDIVIDSLDYYLKAIAPIVNEPKRSMLDELLDNGSTLAKRRFIYDYWSASSGEDAKGASEAYMKIARAVDRNFFNGTSYGFDTDMGYVFLRYGKPDDALVVDDELSAFPYQIWRFNKILTTGENNVKFLFYAPSLSHKDYRLLHSTCRVEYQNPSWEAELYRKIPEEVVGNASEVRTVNDGFTRRARDLWNDF